MDKDEFMQRALDSHAYPAAGKLAACVTKSLRMEDDLSRSCTPFKKAFASKTTQRTLQDALLGADVFIRESRSDGSSADLVKCMAPRPILFALVNPAPAISSVAAHACRDDLIMATGSSSYPEQVNNVVCVPCVIPKPGDPRLKDRVSYTVAQAAIASGVSGLAESKRK